MQREKALIPEKIWSREGIVISPRLMQSQSIKPWLLTLAYYHLDLEEEKQRVVWRQKIVSVVGNPFLSAA